MKVLVKKVVSFLIAAVWSRIDLGKFLRTHKHYLILAMSNLILSLLFIYMAEQVTVRTSQYRVIKSELARMNYDMVGLKAHNAALEAKIVVLRQAFDAADKHVEPNTILKDYEQWTQELNALNAEVEALKRRPLGEQHVSKSQRP